MLPTLSISRISSSYCLKIRFQKRRKRQKVSTDISFLFCWSLFFKYVLITRKISVEFSFFIKISQKEKKNASSDKQLIQSEFNLLWVFFNFLNNMHSFGLYSTVHFTLLCPPKRPCFWNYIILDFVGRPSNRAHTMVLVVPILICMILVIDICIL